MPITFPDNPKRHDRVLELGTDAQDYLQTALEDYQNFNATVAKVNDQIAAAYSAAGLQPPNVTSLDIMKEAGIADTSVPDAVVDVTAVLADIAALVAQVKYLAPAATRALVASGAMADSTAAKVLVEFTAPIFGEVEITVGDIAGNVLGGLVGGVLVAGFDIGIGAIEGAVLKGKLQGAIHDLYPMRTSIRLAQLKAKTLLDSVTAVKTTLDAITGAGVPVTDQLIQALVQRDVQPSVDAANAITVATVHAELQTFDAGRKSYTTDDPS